MSKAKWRESLGSISIKCLSCDTVIHTFPSRAKRKRFCSRDCYATWLSENRSGENHHMKGRQHKASSIAKMMQTKLERGQLGLTGPKHAAWKGGRYLTRGYWMVALSTLSKAEQKLFSPMVRANSRTYVPEHRLVMARKLGRPLLDSEIVHHRNGIKSDNRRRNLEMHDNATHKREHWSILKELRRLRRDNERLRSELSKFLSATSRAAG